MISSDQRKNEICCPITKGLMMVPVRVDPCGHVVDRSVFNESHYKVCPVCDKGIIGYSGETTVERKVDDYVKTWLHEKVSFGPIPIDSKSKLKRLVKLYGTTVGSRIFMERSLPYTFIEREEFRWAWVRYVVDKLFFIFCLVSAMACSYSV